MSAFTKAIEYSAEFQGVENSIKKGFLPQGVLGLTPVQKSHIVSALVGGLEKKALVVVPDDGTAVKTCEDLTALGVSALHYPARSFSFYSNDSQSYEYEQKRIKVLRRMLDGKCDVVVASAEAAISYTIPPETLRQKSVLLKKGEDTTLQNILISLNCAGYTRVDAVEGVGQFSCRGGIVDFFSPDDDEPVRIELWGDTVDTMCRFDVQSQRRTMNIDEILIAPSKEIVIDEPQSLIEKIEQLASSIRGKKTDIIREKLYADIDRLRDGLKVGSADKYMPLIYSPATIFDYAKDYVFFAFETGGIKEKISASQKLLLEDIKSCVDDGTLCKGLDKFTLTFNELVEKYTEFGFTYIDNFARGSFDTPVKSLTTFNGGSLPIWNGKLDVLIEDIEPILKKDTRIVVFAGTEKSAKNLSETLNDENIVSVYFPLIPADFPKGAVSVLPGSLTSGFSYPRDKFYVFTYSKVYQSKTRRRNSGFKAKDTIHSLDELRKGDYIVHAIHGIGIFDGITQLEAN
ncbi:MAG: transcription-repair coupling factor, partial [Clostridia bacterium]|nr:transcription-repair coupling factor [Clostridia bacterium]